MKILSICPSIYPEKLDKMLNSFHLTSYKYNDIVIVSEKKSITEIFNDTFKKYPNYDYYHMQNDDIIYKTILWDMKLIQVLEDYGGGIAYGDDLFQGKNLCAFPMISGDIVRALGWLQMPKLEKYAGDVVWKFIGDNCKCLYYVPEVIIEHKWVGCSNPEINTSDMAAFAAWLPWSFNDLEKIRKVINNESKNI